MAKPKQKSNLKKKRSPKPIPALRLRPSTEPLPDLGHVEETLRDLIGRAEEPQQDDDEPRRDQREQREEAAHA